MVLIFSTPHVAANASNSVKSRDADPLRAREQHEIQCLPQKHDEGQRHHRRPVGDQRGHREGQEPEADDEDRGHVRPLAQDQIGVVSRRGTDVEDPDQPPSHGVTIDPLAGILAAERLGDGGPRAGHPTEA